jgi:hypothetical protein
VLDGRPYSRSCNRHTIGGTPRNLC